MTREPKGGENLRPRPGLRQASEKAGLTELHSSIYTSSINREDLCDES